MNWDDIKNKIYNWDGSWRDIYVHETNHQDWEKWIDFVNSNYQIEWNIFENESSRDKIDFQIIKDYWSGKGENCSTANVFIDKIQINAHFFDDSEIENDIDPREFNSIEDHNNLIDYMTSLSKTLSKYVYLTPENCPEIRLIKVNGDSVELNVDTNPNDWPVRTKE